MTKEKRKATNDPSDKNSVSLLDLIHSPVVDWDRVRVVLNYRVLTTNSSRKNNSDINKMKEENNEDDEFRLEHHEALIAALARPNPIVPPDISRTLLRLLPRSSYEAAIQAVIFNEDQSVEVCRQILLYRYPRSTHGKVRPMFSLLLMDGGHLNMVQAMIERWPRLMYDYEDVSSFPLVRVIMLPFAENDHELWDRRVQFTLKMWYDHCSMKISSYPFSGILEVGEDGCCPLERICSGDNIRNFYAFAIKETPHFFHRKKFATLVMRHAALASEFQLLDEIISMNPTALVCSNESHSGALQVYCAHFNKRIMDGQYPNPSILQFFVAKGHESHLFLDEEMGGLMCARRGGTHSTPLRCILQKLLRDDTQGDGRDTCLGYIVEEAGLYHILKEGMTTIDNEQQQQQKHHGASLLKFTYLKGWRDIIHRGREQVEQFNIHLLMDIITYINFHYEGNEYVCEKFYKMLFQDHTNASIEKRKDNHGRMLLHHILSRTASADEKLGQCCVRGILDLVVNGNVNALTEEDPITGLLPFMQAILIDNNNGASMNNPITLSFELLQRQPDVIEHFCLTR